MKIQIRGRSMKWTKRLRAQVERRLGFALCRFGEKIGRVTVRFSDARTKRAMVDKRCQLDVELRSQTLRVEHTDTDLLGALDRAADHASRSVARELERHREWDDGRPRR